MSRTRKIGYALVLLTIGVCWWFWYTQLSRHPNQMIGQLVQQHTPTSMCWRGVAISTDGATVRLTTVGALPHESEVKTFSIYRKHLYPVNAVSCSYDFDSIASVDEGGTLHVWSTDYYSQTPTLMMLRCHKQSGCALRAVAWKPLEKTYMAVSPSLSLWVGKYVAIGGESGTVQVVSVPDGKVIARYVLPPSTHITCLQWSSNGKYLAVGGYTHNEAKGIVRVWDVQTQQLVSTYKGHPKPVNALAWSPDNRRIASASDDATVQIWSAATGRHTLTYRGHTQRVNALSWVSTNDSKSLIASGSDDHTVQIWNAETGQRNFVHFHKQAVTAVAWAVLGAEQITSGSRDGVIDYYWGVDIPLYLPGL